MADTYSTGVRFRSAAIVLRTQLGKTRRWGRQERDVARGGVMGQGGLIVA
jgi:hypothetical protein